MERSDSEGAREVTDSEGWGYEIEDFERILDLWPGGSFVGTSGGEIVGLVTTIHYERTGWIGSVVVRESHRRSGLGTLLVDRALDHLSEAGIDSILLYAYEGMEGFYKRFGFEPLEPFTAYKGQLRAVSRRTPARRMEPSDLKHIGDIDRYAFGDDRSRLLARILSEFPETCLVLESQNEIVGYAMAMTSQVLTNVGPIVGLGPGCEDPMLDSVAGILEGLHCLLVTPSPVRFSDRLGEMGMRESFRVVRMCRGTKPEGDTESVLGIGALEKG